MDVIISDLLDHHFVGMDLDPILFSNKQVFQFLNKQLNLLYFNMVIPGLDHSSYENNTKNQGDFSLFIKGLKQVNRWRDQNTQRFFSFSFNYPQLIQSNLDEIISSLTLFQPNFVVVDFKGFEDPQTQDYDIDEIHKVLDCFLKYVKHTQMQIELRNLPICILPQPVHHLEVALQNQNTYYFDADHINDTHPSDNKEIHQECLRCSLLDYCQQLHHYHYTDYPVKGIQKVVTTLPNMPFHYPISSEETVQRKLDLACPLGLSIPFQNAMVPLLLIDEDHNTCALYQTQDYPFTLNQWLTIKQREQFYYPIIDPDQLTHFATQLKKLKRHPGCYNCLYFFICPGAYKLGDCVILESEKWVEQFILNLEGTILDVGIGTGFYFDLIRSNSKIQLYFGLDPNPDCVANISNHLPNNQIIHSTLEDFVMEEEVYDFVLLLRSYNHLKDIDKAILKIKMGLKPGGQILIVENSLFSLVHSTPITISLESLNYQHFRNHNLSEARSLLKPHFTIEVEYPVTKTSGNQWILLARKPK